MALEPIIRELARDDLGSLLELYRHLHRDDDPAPERPELEQLWSAILANPALIYLGAFVDADLAAACNACIVPNLTRGGRPYAVIENVVTHERYRRKGVGARVMRALLERCWAQRCYKVMLMSAMHRAEVHAFYDALGFDRQSKQAFVINAR